MLPEIVKINNSWLLKTKKARPRFRGRPFFKSSKVYYIPNKIQSL